MRLRVPSPVTDQIRRPDELPERLHVRFGRGCLLLILLAGAACSRRPASEDEGPGPAEYQIRTIHLLPFSARQASQYLKRLYSGFQLLRRRAAKRMVRAVPALGANPMVLAHMPDLLSVGRRLSKSTEVYEAILQGWLRREQRWVSPELLWEWSKRLALQGYRNRLTGRGDSVAPAELQAIAGESRLELPNWQLGTGSLLTRDAQGVFRFVHQSVLEYLAVLAFLGMSADERRAWLRRMPFRWTEQMKNFALDGFVHSGADLAYLDQGGRDLSAIDLSGCVLQEACLAGCKLTGARLGRASLRRAQLGAASLIYADLSGADLTAADLKSADLTGANLEGATLEDADLSGANLEDTNLRGATLAWARLDADALKSIAPPGTQWDGEKLIEATTGMRFCWIPGGRFQMGGEVEQNESPVHWVRVSAFWLGQTPVTNRQYAAFLEQTGYRPPEYHADPRFTDPEQPVVGVSFQDAMEFCRWLGSASGLQITLPSEAQWEYSARGTDGRKYPWGKETPDASRACFGEDAATGGPAAVGSCPAGRGPYGTLDQAGNVWEWCLDTWDTMAYLKRSGQEPVDPVVTTGDRGVQLVRGGSWFFPMEDLRAAFRGKNEADSRDDDLGFRVAIVS